MAPQHLDGDTNLRRARSNTTFINGPSWLRREPVRPEVTPISSTDSAGPSEDASIESLIAALSPPHVQSPYQARVLAAMLEADRRPLAVLNPILSVLCAQDRPDAVRAPGYAILASCLEPEGAVLSTAERVASFAFFLDTVPKWGPTLWKIRLQALKAVTKNGSETAGYEPAILTLLMSWIGTAFDGLLVEREDDFSSDPLDSAYALDEHQVVYDHDRKGDFTERERCARAVAEFLSSLLTSGNIVARATEDEIRSVLSFYTTLVDRALDAANTFVRLKDVQRGPGHRRKASSLSVSSVHTTPIQQPAALAVELLLGHLTPRLLRLHRDYLPEVIPLYFRSLALFSSPLPRLSPHSDELDCKGVERKITEALGALFTGSYSSASMVILKRHLIPPLSSHSGILKSMRTSIGAHRTLRNHVRRILSPRMAKWELQKAPALSPMSRSNSCSRDGRVRGGGSRSSSSYVGSPPLFSEERERRRRDESDLIARASKEDGSIWCAGKLGLALSAGVKAWVDCDLDAWGGHSEVIIQQGRDEVLTEVAEMLKDVLQELDERPSSNVILDEDEACAVGGTLWELANYLTELKNSDGSPFTLSLALPVQATTPFLDVLSSLLARDHTTYIQPLLSTTLLHIADHLLDEDSASIPRAMTAQSDLSPISSEWLDNWTTLLGNPTLLSHGRPETRKAVMESLLSVYDAVKDMQSYRKPLADLVYGFCKRGAEWGAGDDDCDAMWKILGDEIVQRVVALDAHGVPDDEETEETEVVERFIELLTHVALESDPDETDEAVMAAPSLSSPTSSPPMATPMLSRMQTEFHVPILSTQPSSSSTNTVTPNTPGFGSLWASLSNTGSRSQSHRHSSRGDDEPDPTPIPTPTLSSPPPPQEPLTLRAVGAISALASVFSQLAFTAHALVPANLALVGRVYFIFNHLAIDAKASKARLAALQFLMRIRADRDHRIYFVGNLPDPDGHVLSLAGLVDRGPDRDTGRGRSSRVLIPGSRSRSRVPAKSSIPPNTIPVLKPRERIWSKPETLFFGDLPSGEADVPSEGLISYDSVGLGDHTSLSLSSYLEVIVKILECEKNWEILSYVLCHLPVQLANKHLFCGPKCRVVIAAMLQTLCAGLHTGSLGGMVDRWPGSLKPRDAQGLAQQTLSVLISYKRCFNPKQQHVLVEIFQMGLGEQPSTVKCCLHALGLCAFELPASLTKCMNGILESLSQIMSNPEMAVHILDFLSIIGSLRELHANFRDEDFKTVFGVALQYLQLYNRSGSSPIASWALSQHVRVMAYYLVYVWFLAVRLSDRPRHVPYITRQLLLANEGRTTVDEYTEVCFDWLARYTYASADPRQATSVLDEVLMNGNPKAVIKERTWVVANSIVTIRTLAKLGWVEVVSRRPSGYTKFLCRLENVPMVGPGDVDPDTASILAILLMDRYRAKVDGEDSILPETHDVVRPEDKEEKTLPRPNPITGYVWSGSAPSQRRKDVEVDPSFFPLQMSSYPETHAHSSYRMVRDEKDLERFIRTFDRTPVIDTHKVGVLYVAPGQKTELEILRNSHGSPAYTRFLEGLGRLINLRGQKDVYAGGLNADEHGEYAYAWWDDIGQLVYHTATMMPTHDHDPLCTLKKSHIGNDTVRIVWNDSGAPYAFETMHTAFSFVNIVIEPHSDGAIAAFSNNLHENEYFKVVVQRVPGMPEFTPIGSFKLISAEQLPLVARQLSLLADWFALVFKDTEKDTNRAEVVTNWQRRLQAIRRFSAKMPAVVVDEVVLEGSLGEQEAVRNFTTTF